jgi:hypothetical protein
MLGVDASSVGDTADWGAGGSHEVWPDSVSDEGHVNREQISKDEGADE